METKRRHFELWKREKLVDLLVETETNIEELQKRLDLETKSAVRLYAELAESKSARQELKKQVNLLAGRLGQKETNADFDNSLVMDSDVSLAAIAAKVTEEAQDEHELKMLALSINAGVIQNQMELGTEYSTKRLEAEVRIAEVKSQAEEWKSKAEKVRYKHESMSAKAKWHRDRWIALYTTKTVQTGIRWMIGAATIIGGAYLHLSM